MTLLSRTRRITKGTRTLPENLRITMGRPGSGLFRVSAKRWLAHGTFILRRFLRRDLIWPALIARLSKGAWGSFQKSWTAMRLINNADATRSRGVLRKRCACGKSSTRRVLAQQAPGPKVRRTPRL